MFETVLTFVQRGTTTVLEPLREDENLTVVIEAGLPGRDGSQGPRGNPGDGAAESYDPGDLTLYFENGMT